MSGYSSHGLETADLHKSNLCSPWFWLAAHFGHLWHTWAQITTWNSATDLRSIYCCQHSHSSSQVISWHRCSNVKTYSNYNLDSSNTFLCRVWVLLIDVGDQVLHLRNTDDLRQSHCSDAYSSHSIPLSSACVIEQAWRADAMPRFPVAPTLNSYAEVHCEISSIINIMRYEDLWRCVMYSTQLHPSDKQQESCSPSRPAELQISSHPLELALADPS